MHALRLGFEGIEMLTHRRLTLPVAEPNMSTLRAVRGGDVTKDEALRLIETAEDQLRELVNDCEWEADRAAINSFMVKAHQEHWSAKYPALV